MSNRLPEIGIQGSLQMKNDPKSFQYNEHQNLSNIQEAEEEPFQQAAYDEPSTPPFRSRKEHSSPNKTGGMIELRDLQQEDMSNEPFLGRDATVVIEGEMRQFDNKKTDKIQRYVESLVTGNFMRVQKDVNLQLQSKNDDEKAKKLQSNREFFDRQMKEAQRLWVNRTNKLFNMFLGFLGGMSIMHLIVILSQNDKDSFLQLYSKICNIIQIVFMIFASFGLILSVALTLIYRQKSDEKMRNMDVFRLEFRQHYVVSLICTLIYSICMVLLYILPRYTNILFYWQPSLISNMDITIFKGLSAATNVLFIICWLLASAFNKASIADMDLDPEELDETALIDSDTSAVQ